MPSLDDLIGTVVKMAEQSQARKPPGGTNYWGGTSSEASRAQDMKEWQDKLARIAEDRKISEHARLTERAQDVESKKAEASLVSASLANAAKNATTLEAARIKAGLEGGDGTSSSGTGTGRGKGKSILELASAAAEKTAAANPDMPGKPGSGKSYEAEFKKAFNALSSAQGGGPKPLTFDKDGNPVEASTPVASTAQASKALSGQGAITEDRFKQYGEMMGQRGSRVSTNTSQTEPVSGTYTKTETGTNFTPDANGIYGGKSPVKSGAGWSYQGLQSGMQNDQIAKFTDANGVARFANAGAVSNALQGAPAPAAPAASTAIPGSYSAPDATKFGGGAPATTTTPGSATNPSMSIPHNALGEPVADYGQTKNLQAYIAEAKQANATARGVTPETSFNEPFGTTPQNVVAPLVSPVLETPGFLDWVKDDRKRRAAVGKDPFFGIGKRLNSPSTSTNPLFLNYGQ